MPVFAVPPPRAAARSAAAGNSTHDRGRHGVRPAGSFQRGEIDGAILRLEEVRMHRLVRQKERKGPVVRFLDKGHGTVIKEIGDVALHRSEGALLEELWINELTLPAEADPGIVARAWARIVAHMPLADVCRFIA